MGVTPRGFVYHKWAAKRQPDSSTVLARGRFAIGGAPMRKVLRGLVLLTAVLYVAALVGAVVALRFAGEQWWLTTAGLYLPRILFAAPLPVVILALLVFGLRSYLWTQLVAALVVLFPLMGFVISLPTFKKGDGPVMRLLSYNVDSGNLGYGGVVEEVVHYSPDIVILQEVGPHDELVALLKERFPTVQVSGQLLLATRYNVVAETDPEKLPYGGRGHNARYARYLIETPLGTVVLYNVHPISPRGGLFALRSGGLRVKLVSGLLHGHPLEGFDSTTLMAETGLRKAQVESFAQAAETETLPVIIAGDTNLPGLSRILGSNLSRYEDAFGSVGEGFGYTFPAGHPWMRIDRVFATHTLRFVGFQVGRSSASDHYCVVADLQAR
jgi:endonuclease/exonuclease/phosphatase family metal-dependent hydrolase